MVPSGHVNSEWSVPARSAVAVANDVVRPMGRPAVAVRRMGVGETCQIIFSPKTCMTVRLKVTACALLQEPATPASRVRKSCARVRRVRMNMESKAVNHLFREKWQRQAAPGSVWQWHRSVSGLGRKRRVMVAAMPVNSRLDVQANEEYAVRTAEVKSNVMKDAVPISPSAGPSHFCFLLSAFCFSGRGPWSVVP